MLFRSQTADDKISVQSRQCCAQIDIAKRGDVNLGATLMALDTHFVVSRLDLMLILVAQKRHIGINISQEVAIIADLDSIIGKKNLAHNLVIQSYRSAIQLLLEENNFEDYRAIL